jgi:hypothetical protein
MKTAIIFNLDYENQSIVKCRRLWAQIESRMLAAGFTKVGRVFLSQRDSHTSFARARRVVDRIEAEYRVQGDSTAHYLRDFYGVPYSSIVDLKASASVHIDLDALALKPPVRGVEVDVLATGAFQQFFG